MTQPGVDQKEEDRRRRSCVLYRAHHHGRSTAGSESNAGVQVYMQSARAGGM